MLTGIAATSVWCARRCATTVTARTPVWPGLTRHGSGRGIRPGIGIRCFGRGSTPGCASTSRPPMFGWPASWGSVWLWPATYAVRRYARVDNRCDQVYVRPCRSTHKGSVRGMTVTRWRALHDRMASVEKRSRPAPVLRLVPPDSQETPPPAQGSREEPVPGLRLLASASRR